jgi:glutamyl-tRNA synthetase
MPVRTRIAPSPTGDPHVGTAYMALFNRAFASRHGGQFILRIEDTDVARSTSESERAIFDALRWLGLEWDEGPDVGGPYGPYRQSERVEIYRKHAAELVAAGHAFPCFCTPARLDQVRQAQQKQGQNPGYDGHCIGLSPDEVRARLANGERHVIRMKVPREGTARFHDRLRGDIEIPWTNVDMQVLVKGDGFPTYHLAVVVDDHLMDITHVLRGEEWIPSTPKHVLLFRYFGWDPPQYCHLPLLRNPDKSKLSKRKNPTSINYYRRLGYLPEVVLNYLGTMGWSMPDERDIFSLAEMIDVFDLDRVSLGGPVFGLDKMSWLNGQYLRRLTDDAFIDRVVEWRANRDELSPIVPLLKERTERLIDLANLADYLIGDRRALTPADFEREGLTTDEIVRILQFTVWSFEAMRSWKSGELERKCHALAEATGHKLRDFLFPLFVAVSGRAVALPLFDSMELLGSDLVRMRIRDAVEVLGGVSKKSAKQLEKDYARLVDSPQGGD